LRAVFGIHFLGVLQPVAGFGASKPEPDQRKSLDGRGPEYTAILDRTYRRATDHSRETNYILNLSDIFAGSTEVFQADGRHLTPKGNAVIAKAMFDELSKRQWLQKK
jgi:lysophospholipase L1-like esterase